ncbi:MAG: hypothetical protein J5621_07565 [Paludibacteraceae bacterium]|nr:hypothetical protein [Paludibacteraceae bacterium]
MSPNLLDFTTDGQAIINMPNYKDISFLENFGFSPIESVEQEVSQADSPERAAFLQHYIEMYKQTFTSLPNSYLKEIEEDEAEEFEALDEYSICFRNIRLLHTSAWYMMGHVNAEINAVKQHLEELDGQQVAAENLEEVIRLIRQSQSPQDACARLQKRFEIGYIKAKYILNLPLTQLSSSTIVSTSIEKEDYKLRLEFLQKLQPNGVMGAMYFSKKGIPFHLS